MGLFASAEEKKERELKKKKEKLVNELKSIITQIYSKIQILDGLTSDILEKMHSEEFKKFAKLTELLYFLLEKWIKNKLNEELALRLYNLLSLKGDNPIEKELRSYSQYLSDLEFDIEKYERESDKEKLPFAVEVLPLVKTDALQIQELFKTLRKKIEEIMAAFCNEIKDTALLTLISGVPNPDEWIILPGRNYGSYSYPDLLVSKDIFLKEKIGIKPMQS